MNELDKLLTAPLPEEAAMQELRFLVRYFKGRYFASFLLDLDRSPVKGEVLAVAMGAPRGEGFGDPGAEATAVRYLVLAERAGIIRRVTADDDVLKAKWLGPMKTGDYVTGHWDAFTALIQVIGGGVS